MLPDITGQINRYCSEMSSSEPVWLTELVRYTWLNTTNPRQLSGHLQGRFLSLISKLKQPNCILEIGTFTGYSALCLAEGLSKAGHLHTIEADPEIAFKAGEMIASSPFKAQITVHHGEAAATVPTLGISPQLIFVDADKSGYSQYFDICYPILEPGGILLFDNTLWNGKVTSTELIAEDPDTKNMHAFNSYIKQFKVEELVLLPLRDGLTVIMKPLSP